MCSYTEVCFRMYCARCMTSSVLLILAGIQAVSHSQYYPSSVESDPARSIRDRYFNNRDYSPPFRQHQHVYHSFNDPVGATTTVKYYGTGPPSDAEAIKPYGQSEILSDYRIRPGGRRPVNRPATEFPFGNNGGVDIALRENGEMDIFVRGSDFPRETPEVFRIRPPSDDGTSLERPPETLVVVIRRPSSFPPNCPSNNHRRFRKDGQCYFNPSKGPCGHLMQFIGEHDNAIYGDCVCLLDDGIVSRPLVWWPAHEQCYHLYDQGPCNYYEWLVQTESGDARCAPRKCPQNAVSQSSNEFWFLHEGKCYKTGEHYPKFCDGPEKDSWKVWFPVGSKRPVCTAEKPNPIQSKTLVASANNLPCRPGFKKMQNGECKRIAKFDFDY